MHTSSRETSNAWRAMLQSGAQGILHSTRYINPATMKPKMIMIRLREARMIREPKGTDFGQSLASLSLTPNASSEPAPSAAVKCQDKIVVGVSKKALAVFDAMLSKERNMAVYTGTRL
jgi:hypothetical protein